MEKDERINLYEKEDLFTSTTTPSFSRQIQTIGNMEIISEKNESVIEDKYNKNSKISNDIGYKTRKSSQLFNVRQICEKDSESVVKEISKEACCWKKSKQRDSNDLKEQSICKMSVCKIF